MVRWSGSSAPSNSANTLTQNKDVDSAWKRARLRLGAGDYEDGFLMQIDVHIPLVVSVVIVVEADNHVW